jgi:hypothetical protein
MPADNMRFGARGGVVLAELLRSGKSAVCWASLCETPSVAKPPPRYRQCGGSAERADNQFETDKIVFIA